MKMRELLYRTRLGVALPLVILFVSIILLGQFFPVEFYKVEVALVNYIFNGFGWLFQLMAIIIFGACIYLYFSKFKNIRLGGENAEPLMNKWNWFCITLCTGIGTGVVFWGIAEPITHLANSPTFFSGDDRSIVSLVTVLIHWTILPYSMYSIVGIGIGYAVYNLGMPFQLGSLLYPIFGEKIPSKVRSIIDILSIFSMVFGIVAILGVATMQIVGGSEVLLNIKIDKSFYVIILLVITIVFTISSCFGLTRGIKKLSDYNSKIYFILLAYIFVFGPTTYILVKGGESLLAFPKYFMEFSAQTFNVGDDPWFKSWSVYYWAIWIAYTPISGMFFGKISKGRTIREFINFNLFLPSIFGTIWFLVFGGAAIYQQNFGIDLWGKMSKTGIESSLFLFLESYPLSNIISWIMIGTIFISVVTLCDSMVWTITGMCLKDEKDSITLKIILGGILLFLTVISLFSTGSGGVHPIDITKQISTIAGFPILFIIVLIVILLPFLLKSKEKSGICEKLKILKNKMFQED